MCIAIKINAQMRFQMTEQTNKVHMTSGMTCGMTSGMTSGTAMNANDLFAVPFFVDI